MTKFLTMGLLLFVYSAYGQQPIKINTQNPQTPTQTSIIQTKLKDCFSLNFQCIEIENVLYTPSIRHIEIFLDEKAFSEENLRELFIYLSDKNPAPKQLTVAIRTNYDDVVPKNYWRINSGNGRGISEQPDNPDKYNYHQATFYRRDRKVKNKYFVYNPVLKTDNFKTVIVE